MPFLCVLDDGVGKDVAGTRERAQKFTHPVGSVIHVGS